jgi:hypothetical protein
MPNQVEPGTMGGAPPESGDSGGAPTSAQAAYGGAGGPDVLGSTGPGSLAQQAHDHVGEHEAFHGRPVSWVAVGFIVVGFIVGGLCVVFSEWPIFWVGVGLVVIGALLAAMNDIFEDWY